MKYAAIACWIILCLLSLLIVLKSASKRKIQASNVLLSKLRKQDPTYVAKIKKIHTVVLCLILLLLASLTLRLLQPSATTTGAAGSSLYIVLDNSASMATQDAGDNQISRLALAKDKIKQVILQHPGLQIRLLTFSSDVLPRTEMSSNASAVLFALDNINSEPRFSASGSNVDGAIEYIKSDLQETNNTNASVLLVSDGEQIGPSTFDQTNNGNEQPFQAKSVLISGVGSTTGGDIRYFSYENNKELTLSNEENAQTTTSQLDEFVLEQAASQIDGQYLKLEMDTKASKISELLQLKAGQSSPVKSEYYAAVSALLFVLLIAYEVNPYLAPRAKLQPNKPSSKDKAHD